MKKLKEYLGKDKFKQLKKSIKIDNDLEVPKAEKIIVTMGIGEKGKEEDKLKELKKQLSLITGQMPVVRKAKSSVSAFGVIEGQPVSLQATLRSKRMYDFLTKIIKIILPSWKDFKGVPQKSVTDQGDLTIGLSDSVFFPEINYEKANVKNGLSFTIKTTAQDKEKGKKLFKALGIIFESEEARKARIEAEEKRREEKRQLAARQKAYKEMARQQEEGEEEEEAETEEAE